MKTSPILFALKSCLVAVSETPDDLGPGSRSPSPEPHLEETHEELLDDEFDEEDPREEDEDTSVVAGGYREGWGPVAAVVLWRRVLGILGNVNKIKDPAIHAKVLECLTSIWNMLAKVVCISCYHKEILSFEDNFISTECCTLFSLIFARS